MAGWPPEKNTAFIWEWYFRDADGDLVPGAADLDVEFSIDGGVFVNVAGAEVDEGEGLYSCPISAAEMNGDIIALIAKSSTGGVKSAGVIIYTSVRQIDDLALATGLSTHDTDLKALLPAALVSGRISSDVGSISGDAPAADNLEATYDGTGYADDQAPATQSQLGGIQSAGSAVHQLASSYVLTTGTQSSGTVLSTEALDDINHEHTDVGNAMELYYEFLIGAGLPEAVEITGYLNSANDDLDVYGFDWVASAWVQIGNFEGKAQSTNDVHIFNMFINMVGSGADEGKVRVRFQKASGLSTATLAIDQIFVAFALGASSYANGAIWINTSLSNINTVPGIDGTERNPVSTIAAALTLSASTNLDKFQVSPGSTITLGAAFTNKEMDGQEWTLALGGQDISSSGFVGATITGIGTGTGPRFTHCDMGAVTLPADSHVINCGLEGDQTFGAAGDFFYDKCYSRLANDAAVVFDFGVALNASSLSVRHQSGGVEVRNMGAGTGSYLMSLEGFGQLIINANCSATSAISIRGTFTLTDNAGGAVTLTDDARIDMPQINEEADQALTDYGANTVTPPTAVAIRTEMDSNSVDFDTIITSLGASGAGLTAIPWNESFHGYDGPRGLGIYLNDAAANTNTVNGTDGILGNPVSTIVAAKTIADSLSYDRIYLVNDSAITLAVTMSDYEFVGIGELAANSINLGSQNVNNSSFHNILITGTQGGAGRISIFGGAVSAAVNLHCTAIGCALLGNTTLDAGNDSYFVSCWSGVAGTGTHELTFTANANVSFRHFSGGLQINSMAATNNMSFEAVGGQLIIDATCTGGVVATRGNLTITDNAGGAVTLSDDARIDIAQILAQVTSALATYDAPTKTEMDDAHALLATPAQVLTNAIQALRNTGIVVLSVAIETVTDQSRFIIPATDDAPDDSAYEDAIAVIIDQSDPNQISIREVVLYTQIDRTVVLESDADFTVVAGDTISILSYGLRANAAARVWVSTTRTLTSIAGSVFSQAAADKVWVSASRTLTSISVAVATPIWNVLTSVIFAGGSLGELFAARIPEIANILDDTGELQTDWVDGGRLDLLIDSIKAKTDVLPSGPAKSVALANFMFLMVLSSDDVTPATGLTVTGQISKDGAAFVGLTNAIAEVANGLYKVDLTADELNIDVGGLKFTADTANQRTIVFLTT